MCVRVHPDAVAEARAARVWYAEQDPAAAVAFMAELDAAIERIAKLPHAWPSFEARTRRYLFKRFPYYLIYRTNNDGAEIVAVMHEKRRPGYWRHR